jgi:hypothetical protein
VVEFQTQRRTQRAAALTLAACGLLTLAALFYSPLSPEIALGDLFMLAGGVALLLALRRHSADDHPGGIRTASHELPLARGHRVLIAAGALCLLLMAEGGGSLLGLSLMGIHAQFGLFWLGVVLIAAGLSGARFASLRRAADGTHRGGDLLLLALITLAAFGLRLVRLEDAVHLFVDEMHFVDGIIALWDDPGLSLLMPMSSIAAFSRMYAYMQSQSVAILGPELLSLRLVSVIFGTLTIPAVYLLARSLLDRPTALLAALILATFPPHISLSRIGLNNITDPLFGTLALAFLARGLYRGGGRADFALAGVMLGLTQYFYEGGKLLYPAAVLLWIAALGLRGLRLPWRRLGTAALGFGLTALPLLYVLAAQGLAYMPRLQYAGHAGDHWLQMLTGADGLAQIGIYFRDQFNPAFYHYFQRPEGGGMAFYYGGDTALILPALVPFFFLGLFHLLGRRRLLIPALAILAALGNSLIDHPDWSARFVVAFPALAILIAVGVTWTWPLLAGGLRFSSLPARPRWLIYGVVGLVLAMQVVYFFGPHMMRYNLQLRPFRDHQDIGFRARHFPPGTNVVLFSDEHSYPPHITSMERFWGRELNIQFMHPLHLTLRGAGWLPRGGDLALFVKLEDRELLQFLNRVFDLPPPQYSPFDVPLDRQYWLYYFPHRPAGD